MFTSHDGNTAVTVSEVTEDIPVTAFTSVTSTYKTAENLPNNGTGITSAILLNSTSYMKVKVLGIGNALGANVFTGGEHEMLNRI